MNRQKLPLNKRMNIFAYIDQKHGFGWGFNESNIAECIKLGVEECISKIEDKRTTVIAKPNNNSDISDDIPEVDFQEERNEPKCPDCGIAPCFWEQKRQLVQKDMPYLLLRFIPSLTWMSGVPADITQSIDWTERMASLSKKKIPLTPMDIVLGYLDFNFRFAWDFQNENVPKCIYNGVKRSLRIIDHQLVFQCPSCEEKPCFWKKKKKEIEDALPYLLKQQKPGPKWRSFDSLQPKKTK